MKKKRYRIILYALLFIMGSSAYGEVQIKSIENNKTAQKYTDNLLKQAQAISGLSGKILVGKRNILSYGLDKKAIGVFITEEEYSTLPANVKTNITPVFSEPDIEAQILLIKYLWGKRTESVNIGVIIHPENKRYKKNLLRIEKKHSVNINIIYTDESPAKALNKKGNIDFILALPDKRIYSSKTLKSFINTAHRKQLPIVGFYTGMIKAGAIATTYKDVFDLADATLNLINNRRTFSNFKIDFNKDVLRSYGYKFDILDAKLFIVRELKGGAND